MGGVAPALASRFAGCSPGGSCSAAPRPGCRHHWSQAKGDLTRWGGSVQAWEGRGKELAHSPAADLAAASARPFQTQPRAPMPPLRRMLKSTSPPAFLLSDVFPGAPQSPPSVEAARSGPEVPGCLWGCPVPSLDAVSFPERVGDKSFLSKHLLWKVCINYRIAYYSPRGRHSLWCLIKRKTQCFSFSFLVFFFLFWKVYY